MTFGGQTVTFVTVSASGDPGYLGVVEEARTETEVPGCRFRPLRTEETPDYLTNMSSEIWKCTAPPVAAAITALPDGEVKVGGVTYLIQGPVQPKPDMDGTIHHVTIMCKRQDV